MSPSRFLGISKGVKHYYQVSNTLKIRNYSLERNSVKNDGSTEFSAAFPGIVYDLCNTNNCEDLEKIKRRFSEVLYYNVPEGKKIRGMTLVRSYKLLSNDLSEENVKLSYILGWCVELIQAYLLTVDDVLDNSDTRRGRPAWHKVQGVGATTAVSDGVLLRSAVFELLRIHFRNKHYYREINDLFEYVAQITELGQSMDVKTSECNDSDKFSMKRYSTIAKYKTGYYTFYLPVAAAMYMTGFNDKNILEEVKQILLEITVLFQAQDDFIDVFGKTEVTGKMGTDIKDGKSSWPAVACLEMANPKQREIFFECYGSSDPNKISKIIELYNDLGIKNLYLSFEEKSFNILTDAINRLNPALEKEVFTSILKRIYKRHR